MRHCAVHPAALDEWDVMLPVKTDLISIKETLVAGDHHVIGDDHDPGCVKTAAHSLADLLTRHRVAISCDTDEAGAGDPHGALYEAIKGGRHRHHFDALQLQNFRHRQPVVMRMQQLFLGRTTAWAEPGTQFLKGVEHAVLSVKPNAPATVLNVIFDNALFPSRDYVAEIRIEQVVRGYPGKPSIDYAALAFIDVIDNRFQVVVDAATRHAT